MPVKPFPLLHLESRPLEYILKMFPADELFELSFLDKEVRLKIKELTKNHFNLDIDLGSTNYVVMRPKNNESEVHISVHHVSKRRQYPQKEFRKRIEVFNVPFALESQQFFGKRRQHSFWENPLDGMKFLAKYMYNTFNCDIRRLCTGVKLDQFYIRDLIDHIFDLQDTIPDFELFLDSNFDVIFLQYFLDKFRVIEKLRLCAKPAKAIRLPSKFHLHTLIIDDGTWFTLGHLCGVKFTKGILKKPNLEVNDYFRIVKFWKTGWNPDMRWLLINYSLKDSHFKTLIDAHKNRETEKHRVLKLDDFERKKYGGYDIQRKGDKKTASIFNKPFEICLF